MKKGQLLIAAIFVILIVGLLGIIAGSMISTESFSAVKNLHGLQAFNVAEGGMRFTIATSLAADSDWSDNSDFGPISLGPGTFTIHYVSKQKKSCVIESTGTVQGVSRTIRSSFKKGGLPYQFTDYGLYGGKKGSIGDRVSFYNDSKIVGNFYYYGPIRILGSRPPPCQTGGIIKSTSIDPLPSEGIPDYYESWEAAEDVDPIPWDNTYYDNWLTVAASNAATSLTLSGNSTLNLNGGTRWYRSITVQDNARIIGPGTICATAMPKGTGNFRLEDYAQVSGEVRIIARNDVRIINSAGATGTVEIIARENFDMDHNSYTSGQMNKLYARNGDFTMNNNAIARGSVLVPYGEITCYTNTQIKGLAYAKEYQAYDRATLEGGAVFEEAGSFYNRTMVIQNPDLLPPILPDGISSESTGSFEVSDWGEVY